MADYPISRPDLSFDLLAQRLLIIEKRRDDDHEGNLWQRRRKSPAR